MRLIFYASAIAGAGERLLMMLETIVPKDDIEVYLTVDQVKAGLKTPKDGICIGLFLSSSQENLKELIAIGKLLRKLNIILILPDRNQTTLALAYKIMPRFIAFVDSDMSDVGAVLKSMIRRKASHNFNLEKKYDRQ